MSDETAETTEETTETTETETSESTEQENTETTETTEETSEETSTTEEETSEQPLWNDNLSDELKGHERLNGIESLEDLAQKYADAKLAPEVPEPDGYDIPDGIPKSVGEAANKLELSNEQFKGTIETFNQLTAAKDAAVLEAMEKAGEQETATWGDDKDKIVNLSKEALEYYDSEDKELTKILKESGYGNHPAVLKFFKKLGQEFDEGGFIKSNNKTPGNTSKTAANVMFPNHN